MPYRPNQPCPVCGLTIRPHDPVTTSFRGDPTNPDSHAFIVHRRCESAIATCAACGQPLGEDEPRATTVRPLRSYHFGHQPREGGEASPTP